MNIYLFIIYMPWLKKMNTNYFFHNCQINDAVSVFHAKCRRQLNIIFLENENEY